MPNAAHSQRVLMIQKGKETVENVQKQSVFNQDIQEINDGIELELPNSNTANVAVKIVSNMMNRKASDIYLGITGAYCDLCGYSKTQCEDHEFVEYGFHITRTLDEMRQIFNTLQRDGIVPSRNNDYEDRKGQKHNPVLIHTNVTSCQVSDFSISLSKFYKFLNFYY